MKEWRCVDAEAEAFLADVECTTLMINSGTDRHTNMFQANHEDAYDSEWMKPNDADRFHGQTFLNQEMHQERTFSLDAETEIDGQYDPVSSVSS
ncbi:hypothetical protein Tco_0163273 [Tanacetum coccineum]